MNAMLNADVSDSRIKNANKAMAEMFKECVEMECARRRRRPGDVVLRDG